MGLLDDLKEPPKRLLACKVRATLAQLDKADAAILTEAVEGDKWNIQPLELALIEKGIPISGTVLKKHRNKGCSCFNA